MVTVQALQNTFNQSSTISRMKHTHKGTRTNDACRSSMPHPSFALLGTSLCCMMPSTDACWFTSTIAAASRARKTRSSAMSPGVEPF